MFKDRHCHNWKKLNNITENLSLNDLTDISPVEGFRSATTYQPVTQVAIHWQHSSGDQLWSPSCWMIPFIWMKLDSYRTFYREKRKNLVQSFDFTFRYIDDALSLNISKFWWLRWPHLSYQIWNQSYYRNRKVSFILRFTSQLIRMCFLSGLYW